MNRLAKGMRVCSGLLLLLNLAVFFSPLTIITQSNYPDIIYSQMDYCRNLFSGTLPHEEVTAGIHVATLQIVIIIFCMMLPFVLSLLAGSYGIVGSAKQKMTSIVSFIVCVGYIFLYLALDSLWPDVIVDEEYIRGMAGVLHIILSLAAAIAGSVALIATPGRQKKESRQVVIPQFNEIKEEQERAKYNISTPVSDTSETVDIGSGAVPAVEVPPYDASAPRGVMRGIAGIYAGAEIPFQEGESIRLGRLPDNDLVFDGQGSVSRKHCTLTWYGDRKKFSILDYSSSGSYINGGDDCLPQNIAVWLEPGTIIDIGNADNRFRLE